MMQKGPGEGYHAAKRDARKLNPKLHCRRLCDGGNRVVGFIVGECGETFATGRSAREAWNDALAKLRTRTTKR